MLGEEDDVSINALKADIDAKIKALSKQEEEKNVRLKGWLQKLHKDMDPLRTAMKAANAAPREENISEVLHEVENFRDRVMQISSKEDKNTLGRIYGALIEFLTVYISNALKELEKKAEGRDIKSEIRLARRGLSLLPSAEKAERKAQREVTESAASASPAASQQRPVASEPPPPSPPPLH